MPDRPVFKNILVAVDGSRHSDLALAMALAIAERDHARLGVLTVVPNVNESAALAYGAGVDPVALQGDADHAADKTMREAIEAVPKDQPVDVDHAPRPRRRRDRRPGQGRQPRRGRPRRARPGPDRRRVRLGLQPRAAPRRASRSSSAHLPDADQPDAGEQV